VEIPCCVYSAIAHLHTKIIYGTSNHIWNQSLPPYPALLERIAQLAMNQQLELHQIANYAKSQNQLI
jgi:hypothetical protein